MKVLFFHRWVGVHYGGAESHVKSLALEFSKLGHKVSILTREGTELTELDPSIKVWRISKNPFESDFSYENPILLYFHTGLFMIKSFLKLAHMSIVKGERFDVISVHFATEALVTRLFRTLFKVPYVFVLEGYTRLEAEQAKLANAAIAISQEMVVTVFKNHSYRPYFLPVGIDGSRFNIQIDGSAERSKYLNGFKKLIITVGRIEPRKDYPTLLAAAKIIKNRKLPYRFLIVGDGIDRSKINRLIEDLGLTNEILMIGAVSEEKKAQLYKAADVFVLPTLYEGFGIVFVEAMACGLPIVSTNVGAVSEVVDGAGKLVDPKNPESLAESIVEVLENESLRQSLSLRAIEVSQKYHWQNILPRYEEIYAHRFDR